MIDIISGIYQFRNIVNGRIYIGSSIDIFLRKKNHLNFLNKDKHHSKTFQSAFDEYGEENFEHSIIEIIVQFDLESRKDFGKRLIEREQHYLDTLLFASENNNKFYKLGYNISRIAGSRLGVSWSQESKEKRKATYLADPNIRRNTIEKFKQTNRKNPSIRIESALKHKRIRAEYPEITKNALIKRARTYIENPEIIKKSIEKRKLTLQLNPQIKIRATEKANKSRSEKSILICPHCTYQSKNRGVLVKHHFDNCKSKK